MAVLVTTYWVFILGVVADVIEVYRSFIWAVMHGTILKSTMMIVSRCSNHHNSRSIMRHFANSIFGLAGCVYSDKPQFILAPLYMITMTTCFSKT